MLALLVAMGSMQLGAAFAESLFPTVGPHGATTLRLTFSALILAAVRRPWRSPRPAGATLPLLAYGLSLGAMNTLFYMALRTVPLGIAVALEFIGPLSVAAVASRRWIDGAWIALAATGLILLLPLHRSVGAVDLDGAALALGSGGCWALYILFGRRVGRSIGPSATALGMIIAAAVFAPLGAVQAGPALLSPTILAGGVLLALLSSALPYSLEMVALTRLPVLAFGTMMSLEPAIGALAGVAVLHQHPAPIQWTGMASVILASLGTTLTARADPPAPTVERPRPRSRRPR